MKQYILLTIALATTISISFAQNLNFAWAKKMGGVNNEVGNATIADDSGNVYTIGEFESTADFDPGKGITNLTSAGSYDVFLTKLDANGKLKWAKKMGGSYSDRGWAIDLDDSGNIYITGQFQDVVDFDPGPDTFAVAALGTWDIFVCKLTSGGSFSWVRDFGGYYGIGYSIKVDDLRNIYFGGWFFGSSFDWNPGSGTYSLSSAGFSAFACKLNDTGGLVWVKQVGGGTTNSMAYTLTIDKGYNVYTAGYFTDSTDFDSDSGTYYLKSSGGYDVYVNKLDSSGKFAWAKKFGGNDEDYASGIAIDDSANLYITGRFKDTVDFDPDTGVINLSSTGLHDVFIIDLDSSGKLNWAKTFGGTTEDWGNSIALDGEKNIYITGGFSGMADLKPGVGKYYVVSKGGIDIYITKLDPSGSFLWSEGIGGAADEMGKSITIAPSGHEVFTTGYFSDSVDFDASSGTSYMKSFGGNDVFIHKQECNSNSNVTVSTCSSYVSPSGNYTWTYSGVFYDTIPNSTGCDSFMTFHINLTKTFSTFSASGCGSYQSPSGKYIWVVSGQYNDTIPNAVGCDSVMTINLTLKNTIGSFAATSCYQYTSPSGHYIWTTTGIYTDTIGNSVGCDSIITINLVINNSTTGTANANTCYSYTSPSGKYNWTTSGTYMDTLLNSNGCDSIITFILTINNNSSNFNIASCYQYKSPSNHYTWTSTGTYQDTITNATGCDSVMTINLTIKQSTSSTISPVGCQNYTSPSGKYTWTTSGNFKDTIANAAGCDSIINIQLAITTVDTSVKQVGFTLSSNASGATYQWLDCKNSYSVIAGATNQSFTPTANGDYAVAVTKNSCSDTSSCRSFKLSGIADNSFEQNFTLYPNPTQGKFVIDLGSNTTPVSIIVTDLAGRTLNTLQSQGRKLIEMELNQPAGIYFVTVGSLQGKLVMKVVKE